MVEDQALNAFLKRNLEAEVALPPARLLTLEGLASTLAQRRRTRRRWLLWGSPALAAGLGLCLMFAHFAVPASATPSASVGAVIRLLAVADGLVASDALSADGEDVATAVVAADKSSTADLLLAWQEAPCADLL